MWRSITSHVFQPLGRTLRSAPFTPNGYLFVIPMSRHSLRRAGDSSLKARAAFGVEAENHLRAADGCPRGSLPACCRRRKAGGSGDGKPAAVHGIAAGADGPELCAADRRG